MPGHFYRLTMGLVTIDLWVLLKARKSAKFFIKILHSLLQVLLIIALGTGALLAYTLAKDKTDVPVSSFEYSHSRPRPMKDGLLSMETASLDDSAQLQQKLDSLKNQALNLELSLQKMKSQYKDLTKIARSNYREEEIIADFASEAAGGTVLDTPDTESYYEPWHQQTTLFGIPIWKADYFTPRKVIQPWTQAGECWAFKGSWGKIVIELAYPTLIEKVTLEHIPVSASLTGSVNSAPKDFVLYGLVDRTFVRLGDFTYDINGPSPTQTFKLKEKAGLYPIRRILIEIQSNWGHPDYTCVYRFKVHGKLSRGENIPGIHAIEEDKRKGEDTVDRY